MPLNTSAISFPAADNELGSLEVLGETGGVAGGAGLGVGVGLGVEEDFAAASRSSLAILAFVSLLFCHERVVVPTLNI